MFEDHFSNQSPQYARCRPYYPAELPGYQRTWSCGEGYHAERGFDPLDTLHPPLSRAWCDAGKTRRLRWPLALRVGGCQP